MTNKKQKPNSFLSDFPHHMYRYIDQTGQSRPPVSSEELKKDLNENGYESYFTVNGFSQVKNNQKETLLSLNAFFIDIDDRKNEEELEMIKKVLPPTYIIETKRGYHIYWILDEIIYRDDYSEEEWNNIVKKWENIEGTLVKLFGADPAVKDVTRILRVPNTYYWKKTGDKFKEPIEKRFDGVFKIKGIFKDQAKRYSMNDLIDILEIKEVQEEEVGLSNTQVTSYKGNHNLEHIKRKGQKETEDFFTRLDLAFPIIERDSFIALYSGEEGTLPPNINSRNEALLVVASLARRAGISKKEVIDHFNKVGWHGIEKERSGRQEIINTIESAYRGGYTFSRKHEVIDFNISEKEESRMSDAIVKVSKERKELDKIRYGTYEFEILAKYPNLKKNEVGMIFNYKDGVYYLMSKQDVASMILNEMYEDMLFGYRTTKSINDKLQCLISIIPDFYETRDDGKIINVKNGLLNIETGIVSPHTPEYISLVQIPIIYDPSAKAPLWEKCIDAWTEGEGQEEKKTVLQQYAGYLLLKSQKHAAALFLIGDGGNGKSTFIDTLAMVLGTDIVSRIDLEDLYSQFGIGGLLGKRLNVVEEISGNYYESHKLKKLISGEEVTAQVKYKEPMKFHPEAKFVFALNQMPRIDDSSMGSERRMLVVEFLNNFRERPNTELRFKNGLLAEELQGIFNWMLEGEKNLREMGRFLRTKDQDKILQEFRRENSSVDAFIYDCLAGSETNKVESVAMYDAYREYCMRDGRKAKARITFTKEMKNYGQRTGMFSFHERINGHSKAMYEGVKLMEEGFISMVESEFNKF